MFKYSKTARQQRKAEIANQLKEQQLERIAIWEETAEYEANLLPVDFFNPREEMEEDLRMEEGRSRAKRYDDLFDERFVSNENYEYDDNPWFD